MVSWSSQLIKTANDEYVSSRNNMMYHLNTTSLSLFQLHKSMLSYSKYSKFSFAKNNKTRKILSFFVHEILDICDDMKWYFWSTWRSVRFITKVKSSDCKLKIRDMKFLTMMRIQVLRSSCIIECRAKQGLSSTI